MNSFGLLVVILIVVTLFAPLFMGGLRKPLPTLQTIELRSLRKAARRAYISYMIGGILYVLGILADLPFILLNWNFPSIARFEGDIFHVQVVIYNHFVLTGREFDIYYLALPLFLLAATLGMIRFEKSYKVMQELERHIKDLS